jgi:hypothetical protein
MSINRITRERLFQDEKLFNSLLPYAKYDDDHKLFVHSDASLWSIWDLQPLWLTKTSDSEAFQICASIQEMLDALDHTISAQFVWITTMAPRIEANLTKRIVSPASTQTPPPRGIPLRSAVEGDRLHAADLALDLDLIVGQGRGHRDAASRGI